MARRKSQVRRAGSGQLGGGAMAAVGLIALALTLVVVQSNDDKDAAGNVANPAAVGGDDFASVIGRIATAPFRAVETYSEQAATMWTAAARVERLERENAELRAWRTLAEQMAERNARYEALLGMPPAAFGEGAMIENSIAAQLVLDSGGPFRRTLVANAGNEHGVKVGYVVMNENGLIGRVVSVGARSSRILLVDDDSSRVPVMGATSRVRAVLVGDAGRQPQLATLPFDLTAPRLEFIVGARSLRDGEPLVTSGDGGVFPRGIPVGEARATPAGEWRVALVASRRPIDFVRILPYAAPEAPEATAVADGSLPPARALIGPAGSASAAPVVVTGTVLPSILPGAPRPTGARPSPVSGPVSSPTLAAPDVRAEPGPLGDDEPPPEPSALQPAAPTPTEPAPSGPPA